MSAKDLDEDPLNSIFICCMCKETFAEKDKMVKHLEMHNSNTVFTQKSEPVILSLKNSKLSEKSSSKTKVNAPNKDGLYTCRYCNFKLKSEWSLGRHERKHMMGKNVTCGVCDKKFFDILNLKDHMKIHTGERNYICKVCNQSFVHRRTLSFHQRLHTGEKAYSCEICNKSFTQKGHLTSHLLTHTGERSHSCNICFMCFAHKSALKRHMMVHLGLKPFKCDTCGKSFRRKDMYTKHCANHKKTLDKVCKECNVEFSTPHGLLTHLGALHSGRNNLSCNVCKSKFGDMTELREHYILHNNEKAYFCDICDLHFNKDSILERHNEIEHPKIRNSFKCENCNKSYSIRSSLNRHLKNCNADTNGSESPVYDMQLTNIYDIDDCDIVDPSSDSELMSKKSNDEVQVTECILPTIDGDICDIYQLSDSEIEQDEFDDNQTEEDSMDFNINVDSISQTRSSELKDKINADLNEKDNVCNIKAATKPEPGSKLFVIDS